MYHFCSNADPRMTFDLFTALSNFCPSCCGNVAWHLQVCSGCFIQVSESLPMSHLFQTYLRCSPSGPVMAPEFGSGLLTNMATVSHL